MSSLKTMPVIRAVDSGSNVLGGVHEDQSVSPLFASYMPVTHHTF